MRMLLTVALLMQGVWFFFIFAVNRDSGTHPNIFLGIILTQNSCQNECDSESLEDRASVGRATTDKKVWSFSGISQRIEILAHITCCSLGSNYPKTVELCSPKLSAHKS